MHLYYYSFKKQEFAQFFPRTVNVARLEAINRYNNTARGIIPLLIWGAVAAATAIGAWLAKDKILEGAAKAVMEGLIFISSCIFDMAGWFFTSMAYILDNAISSTISNVPYQISTISIGWTAVRDLSNMFFIFVLLYIAILTILGMAGGSAKRWLSHIIIAALLINFSLFLTGVVIDAGNVLAMGFWNKMTTTQGGVTGPSASAQLMQGLAIQTTADPVDATGKPIEKNQKVQLFSYIGGTIVRLIAGYVFLAGAVMMIIRTVTLMLLMIVSPFAFLGFALPKGGGFANQWLSKLIGNTFVAPAFLAMLYIDSLIINSTDLNTLTGADKSKFAAAFSGDVGSFPIIYHYVLVIILMLASLTVANQVSSGAGSTGGTWAKKLIGGGAAAGFMGVAAAGRQTVGRAAAADLKNEEWVKKQNQLIAKGGMRGRLANLQLATLEKAKKGTFDIRNAPMGGLGVTAGLGAAGIKTGTASKKSYDTHGQVGSWATGAYRGTEKEKELIATAKARFPNDPVAQQAYITQRGVELDAVRNKEVKETLNKEISKEENKKALAEANKSATAQAAELKTKKEALRNLEQQKAALVAAGQAVDQPLIDSINTTAASAKLIEDNMKEAEATVRKSMQRMTGEDVAKLMEKKEYRDSTLVRNNLSSKDYTAINKRYMEGSYKGADWGQNESDTAMMAALTTTALASDQVPENTKRAIKNQMKNGTWGHDINFQEEVAAIVSSGKDEHGNHVAIADADFTPEKRAKLEEIRSMMDNDDIAALDNSLITNKHLAKDYSAKTLASINKKQLESGGESDTAFVNDLRNAVLTHNRNQRTIDQIITSTGKKDSMFYDEDLATRYKQEKDAIKLNEGHLARERGLKAKKDNGTITPAEQAELDTYTR